MIRPLEKNTVPYPEREELKGRIRKYIDHCRFICSTSHSPEYKTMRRANSIDMLMRTLYPMLKADSNFNVKEICQFTLMHQPELTTILPVHNNNSFQSAEKTLNEIIDDCKSIINHISNENHQRQIN